jgi:hypothetical protein
MFCGAFHSDPLFLLFARALTCQTVQSSQHGSHASIWMLGSSIMRKAYGVALGGSSRLITFGPFFACSGFVLFASCSCTY